MERSNLATLHGSLEGKGESGWSHRPTIPLHAGLSVWGRGELHEKKKRLVALGSFLSRRERKKGERERSETELPRSNSRSSEKQLKKGTLSPPSVTGGRWQPARRRKRRQKLQCSVAAAGAPRRGKTNGKKKAYRRAACFVDRTSMR